MPILLSSGSIPAAYEHAFLNTLGEESFSFFSDPEVARSCRARELIETPEFKPWDEGAMLGKTRALRSEVSGTPPWGASVVAIRAQV